MIWDYQKLSLKRCKNQYCLKDILIKQKFGAPQGVAELNTDKSFASGNHKQPLVYLVATKLPNYVATDGAATTTWLQAVGRPKVCLIDLFEAVS